MTWNELYNSLTEEQRKTDCTFMDSNGELFRAFVFFANDDVLDKGHPYLVAETLQRVTRKLFARVLTDLHFISTDFRLKEGEMVELQPADNIPGKGQYWAEPVDGRWHGASMLVESSDIKIF